MSEIVEILNAYDGEGIVRARVRCAGCGRMYVTNQNRTKIKRLRRCWGCRVFIRGTRKCP